MSPNVRKLGHAPRSICETGISGVTGDSIYFSDSVQGQYPVQPAVNTRLHPLTTCISNPSAAPLRQAARRSSRRDSNPGQAMTPARSVPEMEVEPQITNVPYQQLDSRHLMGQLSYSQTASVTSDGSQVSSNLKSRCMICTLVSVSHSKYTSDIVPPSSFELAYPSLKSGQSLIFMRPPQPPPYSIH